MSVPVLVLYIVYVFVVSSICPLLYYTICYPSSAFVFTSPLSIIFNCSCFKVTRRTFWNGAFISFLSACFSIWTRIISCSYICTQSFFMFLLFLLQNSFYFKCNFYFLALNFCSIAFILSVTKTNVSFPICVFCRWYDLFFMSYRIFKIAA